MFKAYWQEKHTQEELRKFGLLIGGCFALLFLLAGWRRGHWHPALALVAGLLLLFGLLLPRALHIPYKLWMAFGHVLGWVNSYLLLGLIFFLMILPLGLWSRLKGTLRFLQGSANADTYRVVSRKRAGSHLEKPY